MAGGGGVGGGINTLPPRLFELKSSINTITATSFSGPGLHFKPSSTVGSHV